MGWIEPIADRGALLRARWSGWVDQPRRWGDVVEWRLANAIPRVATWGPVVKTAINLPDRLVKSWPPRDRERRDDVRYWRGRQRVSWRHSGRATPPKRVSPFAESRPPRLSSGMAWDSHSACPNTDQCPVPMPGPFPRACAADTSRSLPKINVRPD